MVKQIVYTLLFTNDGNETEDYGTYATRALAEAEIKQVQKEYGKRAFPTVQFDINEHVLRK